MARAFVTLNFSDPQGAQPVVGPGADEFTIDLPVLFAGSDLPGGIGVDQDRAVVVFAFGDSVNVMGTKVGTAVRALATSRGYVVGANAVLVSTLAKV